jgi:hypothetical protein
MRSNIWSFAIVELVLSLTLRVGANQTDADQTPGGPHQSSKAAQLARGLLYPHPHFTLIRR